MQPACGGSLVELCQVPHHPGSRVFADTQTVSTHKQANLPPTHGITHAGADGNATPRFAAYGATKRGLAQLGKSLQVSVGASVCVCVCGCFFGGGGRVLLPLDEVSKLQ